MITLKHTGGVSIGCALAAHLIKISKQPRLGSCERMHPPICVPDRKTASHKLVPTRRIHWIDGHEAATKGYCSFRSVRTGRIVLWHNQAMPARIAVMTGSSFVYSLDAQDSSTRGLMIAFCCKLLGDVLHGTTSGCWRWTEKCTWDQWLLQLHSPDKRRQGPTPGTSPSSGTL